ncbi:hypothetical protein [Auraticoccus monumenti]|uniref:Uncharacterized protein n=1 Tax=Auraticoccus monumenti TaxID=675864 RepID=A0A1G7EB78_9ACTN|nr:hypothetical protein [Auraticoccus monumenti]SDE60903.1 hypothetical protein SAMN04489747_3890 [Auraticoccus monumenti]
MALQDLACAQCGTDDDIEFLGKAADGRIRLRCTVCDLEWVRGTAVEQRSRPLTIERTKARFPGRDDVSASTWERVDQAKVDFLTHQPETDPAVAPYFARYREIFSADGLDGCDPQDLKDFANSSIGASPGNQSTFNQRWKELGEVEASRRTRETLRYLLHGPEDKPLEDRLNALIEDTAPVAMPGFKEALLTRALCVAHPDRFLPLLVYTSARGGKREIAEAVYGLKMPKPEVVTWTLGRLIVWSNDVLVDLLGDGFHDLAHASHFLNSRWAARTVPA